MGEHLDSETTIHVAHCIARRGGTHYRARAYAVTPIGIKCTRTVAIEDSAGEAESVAVQYIRDQYRRDGLAAPETVVSHGRKPGAIVDSYLFGV